MFVAYVSMPQQINISNIRKHWDSFVSHCMLWDGTPNNPLQCFGGIHPGIGIYPFPPLLSIALVEHRTLGPLEMLMRPLI